MKKRLVSLLSVAILLASSVLIGCKNETSEGATAPELYSEKAAPTGYVMGYVVDNRGEPVKDATVTLGNKTATTNAGGEFQITGVSANDLKKLSNYYPTGTQATPAGSTSATSATTDLTGSSTAYAITATKKGYLSAVVPAIYVASQETETEAAKNYKSMLSDLSKQFNAILGAYAGATATTGTNGASTGLGTTTTSTTSSNGDSVIDKTVTTTSNAEDVMKIIAKAMADLADEAAYDATYREFYSTFAKAVLIPLDASFSGKIELQLKTKDATTYDATTYVPTSKPVVRASYTPAIPAGNSGVNTGYLGAGNQILSNTAAGTYTYTAQVDQNGKFTFEGLPSGVPLSFSVDSFFETVNDKEYIFSSESAELKITNNGTLQDVVNLTVTNTSGNVSTTTTTKVKLNGTNNSLSAVFLLYAQNDKIAVTATNVDSISSGKLLTTKDALEFTFSKPMLNLSVENKSASSSSSSSGSTTPATTSSLKDLGTGEYTIEWSTDKTKATITPVAGYWTVEGTPTIKLSGEAVDGAKKFLNDEFDLYFDTKVWVSISTKTLNDYNDYIDLKDPIVLEFSKPMNEKIALTLSGTNTAYDEAWNEDRTELTITPVLEFWKVTGQAGDSTTTPAVDAIPNKVTIKVKENSGSSKEFYNKDFSYWKTGAASDGSALEVFFDNYIDVKVEKATITGKEGFTLTFDKPLKSFSKANNITSIKCGDDTVEDYIASIDSTNTIVTIESLNPIFKYEGRYEITLKGLEAKDGSTYVRELGDKEDATPSVQNDFKATTNFAFDGAYLDVLVEDASTATEEAIKLTFSKKLKAFDEDNITSINVVTINGNNVTVGNAVNDYIYTLDTTGKVLTITSKNPEFKENGRYYIALKDLEAEDGSVKLREINKVGAVTSTSSTEKKINLITDFSFKGLTLKILDVDVIDRLPANAVASRSIVDVKPSDVLKVTFNMPIYKSEMTVGVGTVTTQNPASSPKNYIDSTDASIVYVPLSDVGTVNDTIVLGNFTNVIAEDGTTGDTNTSASWTKWSKDTQYRIYAAITLVDTSLVALNNTASDIPYYDLANVIDASTPMTFTFSAAPDKVYYTLYRYDGNGNTAVKVDDGQATLTGATATVSAANLIPVADKSTGDAKRETEYFIDINAVNTADVTLFSTTNAWTYNASSDFEGDNTVKALFDKPGDTSESKLGFGTIKLYVKPLSLIGTNIYDENAEGTAKIATFEPKSALTFTFDADLPAASVVEYTLFDSTGDEISNGTATKTGATATVNDANLIYDEDHAAAASRISTYFVALTIKESAEEDAAILFSTEKNFPLTASDTFENDIITDKGIFTANDKGLKLFIKPLTLVGTNLYDEEADTIATFEPKSALTFTFDSELPADSVIEYSIFDSSTSTTPISTGTGTKSEATVTINDANLIYDEDNAATATRVSTYFVALTIKESAEEDAAILFSTENKFPLTASDTFEKDTITGKQMFTANKGLKFYIKPLTLIGTNLYDEDADAIASFEPKSALTFTFDSALPAASVVEYALYDSSTSTTPISTGTATKNGATVTVNDENLIIDDTANTATGTATYYIALTVKESAEEDAAILFNTAEKFPLSGSDDSFEKDTISGKSIFTANDNGLKVIIKPYTIIAAEQLATVTQSWGEDVVNYNFDPLLPGTPVDVKFSSTIPADSKIKWEIYDSSDNVLSAENVTPVNTATDTFRISSDVMIAEPNADTTYKVWIQVEDADGNILFSTENKTFGTTTDSFEDTLKDGGYVVSAGTGTDPKYLAVKIIGTKVVTEDSTLRTNTSAPTPDYLTSYKQPIVLKFTHPVDGYKAVLYTPNYDDRIYTKPIGSVTTLPVLTDADYDEWTVAASEYIYESTYTFNTEKDEITITPTNYFGANAPINVALFDENGIYTDIHYDDTASSSLVYATAPATNASNLNINEMLEDSSIVTELEYVTNATASGITTSVNDVGNGRSLAFRFATAYSTETRSFAKYTVFVKTAESEDYVLQGTRGIVGKNKYNDNITVPNYRLYQEDNDKTFLEATLGDDAFRYGDSTVEVVILKEFNGVRTLYHKVLEDKSANTIASGKLDITIAGITGSTLQNATGATAQETDLEFVGTGANPKTEDDGLGGTTNNTVTALGNITITISNDEWIKRVTVQYIGQTNENLTADNVSGADNNTPRVQYQADSNERPVGATATLQNVSMYEGDAIKVSVTDTSDNTIEYTYTIKH
ncbi:MAG: carboxypeptidase regulatory-like domain-containing protein [Treponema sp.]|nr:carboxypeptidase regulatory-like domain-containing protein [Treponema sp.]